jgi:hypothetical protein
MAWRRLVASAQSWLASPSLVSNTSYVGDGGVLGRQVELTGRCRFLQNPSAGGGPAAHRSAG